MATSNSDLPDLFISSPLLREHRVDGALVGEGISDGLALDVILCAEQAGTAWMQAALVVAVVVEPSEVGEGTVTLEPRMVLVEPDETTSMVTATTPAYFEANTDCLYNVMDTMLEAARPDTGLATTYALVALATCDPGGPYLPDEPYPEMETRVLFVEYPRLGEGENGTAMSAEEVLRVLEYAIAA